MDSPQYICQRITRLSNHFSLISGAIKVPQVSNFQEAKMVCVVRHHRVPMTLPSQVDTLHSLWVLRNSKPNNDSCPGLLEEQLAIVICRAIPSSMPLSSQKPQSVEDDSCPATSDYIRIRAKYAWHDFDAKTTRCSVTEPHPWSDCDSREISYEVLPSQRGG